MTVMERRLRPILDAGATEGSPDYWYGAVDGFAGSLWPVLFTDKSEAAKCAKEIEGRVVIVSARVLHDADGNEIEPEN
jgi:hypothetical protein